VPAVFLAVNRHFQPVRSENGQWELVMSKDGERSTTSALCSEWHFLFANVLTLGFFKGNVTRTSYLHLVVRFFYCAFLLVGGCQCHDCDEDVYSRSCISKDIHVSSGLCNGTRFSIRACEFYGSAPWKMQNFINGVSVISDLTSLNCTDELDHACKKYFPDSRVKIYFNCLFSALPCFDNYLLFPVTG
jgi:hypothetical protein